MATEVLVEEVDVQEEFLRRGWTDGLPVIPPTPELVAAMLELAGVDGDEIVGTVPERSREITAEKAAINAVMAGCAPEHFPVVLAALAAILHPRFGCHTVVTSTGGAALCVVVSGPSLGDYGFNSFRNALGPGHRANASVGRAVRLVAMNVLGARSDALDGSSLGHPGKYSMLVAEEAPPEGWNPLRVELGFDVTETTVTVFPSESPHQIANHLTSDPIKLLRTFAAAMTNPATFCVGKGHQAVLVVGMEHRTSLAEAGWTPPAIREWLAEHTRVTPEQLLAGGILLEHTNQNDMTPGPDGKLATVRGPDDIFLVTAGSAGAGWSAYIPNWAPTVHSEATSCAVLAPGEGMPTPR